MFRNRSPPNVEVREDPWKRTDCYAVELVSKFKYDSNVIENALQSIGFVFKNNDLAGPIYTHRNIPSTYARIDERHKYKTVTPLIFRQEPVAQQNIQEVSTQIRKLDSKIRLILRHTQYQIE